MKHNHKADDGFVTDGEHYSKFTNKPNGLRQNWLALYLIILMGTIFLMLLIFAIIMTLTIPILSNPIIKFIEIPVIMMTIFVSIPITNRITMKIYSWYDKRPKKHVVIELHD